LAIAAFQLYGGETVPVWSTIVLVIVSVLNLGLPVLAGTLKVEARQRRFDWSARAYEILQLKLKGDVITPEEAMQELEALHQGPVERRLYC